MFWDWETPTCSEINARSHPQSISEYEATFQPPSFYSQLQILRSSNLSLSQVMANILACAMTGQVARVVLALWLSGRDFALLSTRILRVLFRFVWRRIFALRHHWLQVCMFHSMHSVRLQFALWSFNFRADAAQAGELSSRYLPV